MQIVPFTSEYQTQVVDLIVSIQRGEFGLPIGADQQPDLREIPDFYQRGDGGFWLAVEDGRVLGTIALLDIGEGRAALRKMFVAAEHRGQGQGVARRLLDTLLAHARRAGTTEIVLGTTPFFHAAHRFYEKNGFEEMRRDELPPSFPVMEVDTRFYRLALARG